MQSLKLGVRSANGQAHLDALTALVRRDHQVEKGMERVAVLVSRGYIERAHSVAFFHGLSMGQTRKAAVEGIRERMLEGRISGVEFALNHFGIRHRESLKIDAIRMLRRPIAGTGAGHTRKEWDRIEKVKALFGISEGQLMDEVAKAIVIRAFRGEEESARMIGSRFGASRDFVDDVIHASRAYRESKRPKYQKKSARTRQTPAATQGQYYLPDVPYDESLSW